MCRRPSLVLITSVAGDGHNVLVLDPLPRLPRYAAPPGLSPLGPLILPHSHKKTGSLRGSKGPKIDAGVRKVSTVLYLPPGHASC